MIKKHSFLCRLMLLLTLSCMAFLSGCTGFFGAYGKVSVESEDRLNVVTTIFPYYDFLRQIAGDRIRLTLVVPAGMDSHSFEPTPADMITIQNADLLVCNGGAMEQWVAQVVASFDEGEGPKRVETMMDYVEVLEEELVEGMEHSHGHDVSACTIEAHHHDTPETVSGGETAHIHVPEHEHAKEHEHQHETEHEHTEHEHRKETTAGDNTAFYPDDGQGYEIEYDEHIWTSPVNAGKLVSVLASVLGEEDPEYAEEYQNHADSFLEKLTELDQKIRETVAQGKRRLLVFGDKFPLRYFFDEYDLQYRAAFSGCSSDTEPSAKTIAYLIDKVREEKIPVVYYLELSSPRVAEIISEETKAEPLLFHTCHNLTRRQFDSGITYLELMEQNVEALRQGLN